MINTCISPLLTIAKVVFGSFNKFHGIFSSHTSHNKSNQSLFLLTAWYKEYDNNTLTAMDIFPNITDLLESIEFNDLPIIKSWVIVFTLSYTS